MRWLNYKFCLSAVVFLLSCVFSSAAFSGGGSLPDNNRLQHLRPGKQQAGSFTGTPDIIYKAGEWQLNVYLTHKGSRSQGRHGVLLKNRTPVNSTKGETLDTPIGKVQYNGPYGFQAHLWDSSGWMMVEPKVTPQNNESGLASPKAPDLMKLENDLKEIHRKNE